MDWQLRFRELYENIIKVCTECGGTGNLDAHTYCSCYISYAHKVICSYAGYSNQCIDIAQKAELPKTIDLDKMIERRLGLFLVGPKQYNEIFICYQLWKNIDIFARLYDPSPRRTVKFFHNMEDLENIDVGSFEVQETQNFNTLTFYERAIRASKCIFLMANTHSSMSKQEAKEYGLKLSAMLKLDDHFQVNLTFKLGEKLPNFDLWEGVL